MKLKRLEILGFKSFADKISLKFDTGITAVVGPNGCGKSNIADAFRWVMGENARSMRAVKTSDVIFAGTNQRKPLNFAEVTLTLSDIAGDLPTDYDEVSITRRLHRNGDSEYFINRKLVRLKDVQSLLLDSGLGKDAYSIFEQGEIDRVINLAPLERRYIFEEAAGILRFLQRKREALRKLEQTTVNVSRVKDIHQEVEKQIIVLQEQSEKAKHYKQDKLALEKLEKELLIVKWESLHKKWKDLSEKTQEQEVKVNTVSDEIDTLNNQINMTKADLTETETIVRARQEDLFRVKSTKEVKSKEKQSNEERLKELLTREKQWKLEIETLAEKRKSREIERKETENTHKECEQKQINLNKTILNEREKLAELEINIAQKRSEQQSKQKELLEFSQTESQHGSDLKQSMTRLEASVERLNRLQIRKKQLMQEEADLKQITQEKKLQLHEDSRGIESQKELFNTMEKDLQGINLEIETIRSDIDKMSQELSENKARHKALQRLREDMEGFSSGTKKLIQESTKSGSLLFNKLKPLYEYFIPNKGGEIALASAMRPYAQTLATETEADFKVVLDYIHTNNIKDVSLVCLEHIEKIPPHEKNQDKTIKLSPLTEKIIQNTLTTHFLHNVYIEKSSKPIAELINLHPKLEICALPSTFIDSHSVVFCAIQGENSVFVREAELKTLAKKIEDSSKEKERLDTILNTIQQRRIQLQTDRSELDKTIRRAEIRLVELNMSLQKNTLDLQKIQHEEKQQTQELDVISKTIADLTLTMNQFKQTHEVAKQKTSEIKKDVDNLNLLVDSLSKTLKQQSQEVRNNEFSLQKIVEETRKQTHFLHVLEVKDIEANEQQERLTKELEEASILKSKIEHKGTELHQTIDEVNESLNTLMKASTEVDVQLKNQKKTLEHLEGKIREKGNSLKKLENEHHQFNVQSAQLESQYKSVERELQERYELSIEKGRELFESLNKNVEQIESALRLVRQKIENAGDINMTSIEECEKHQTRYAFINQQLDDLNVSRQELTSIITGLDDDSRKIFKETFEKISSNFKKNFQILFNGGEAELLFTESADILDAGIEIIAKPPGKQMRSINLLSGGEKCLTAMALLFAIFEVKPAPFCILDEIDAPLDDTNVERFVNIVQTFVNRCQFVMITHNKQTMSIADVIFGISMEERGVSKILTMDFSKSEEMLDSSYAKIEN